ncbi:ATP-dependent DNA ligase [Chiayiivirga flava]|uniref:DNA ligase (ATP) n=1 Tax=Chiayiivirga flava TaxID=659595 RepID=A0A7W8D4F6_9GAMM|nr:DNA ligase-1 [Chiayiivirga flava]
MQRFADLYDRLDRSTATLDKRAALIDYFKAAPPDDAVWALYFLVGRKLAKIVSSGELRAWIVETSGLPLWLVEDSYAHVGDLAETLTLLVPDPNPDAVDERPLRAWVEDYLIPLRNAPVEERAAAIKHAWQLLPQTERLLFNKLLTGALRVGVSQRLVQQALAQSTGIDIAVLAQRMMGEWPATTDFLAGLLSPETTLADRQQPYPFFLASPLEQPAESLGDLRDWLLEWKWDGIRLQLIRRDGTVALWSRGEERLDGRFPEIEAAAAQLPDGCVIDGELLAWENGAVLPFARLQRRIGRLKPGAKMLAEHPVAVQAYDLLERDGVDLRMQPLATRRAMLAHLLGQLGDPTIAISPEVHADSWTDAATQRDAARERGVEGLMLKWRDSTYQVGRRRGDWWKWKIDPLTIDAVLIYAQSGSGRRATLYTDYTFALWDGDKLVPVAKAYSGLDDKEILKLDRWIRANTLERFGPVRSVKAEHVFELGFEGVNLSTRHKSGVAVRFPRILRWRDDKRCEDADRLETLKRLAS